MCFMSSYNFYISFHFTLWVSLRAFIKPLPYNMYLFNLRIANHILIKIKIKIKLQELKFYYKYVNNSLPYYYRRPDTRGIQVNRERLILNLNSNVYNYNTRRMNDIHIVGVKNTKRKESFLTQPT